MPDLSGNERKYLNECMDEGWISSQGRFVAQFEELVLRDLNQRYSLSTSNGTVALHLALVALGVGKGDEVIVPDITFGATLNAIAYVGAVPVIIDVNPKDWNICRDKLDTALTAKTKAVMPVALFGNPSGLNYVADWASNHGLVTIVDAAEAVGAKINGEDIGSFGDAVTYSYFGNKTITTGEGGAVVFRDKTVAENARILRDHGMTPGRRYHHEVVGFNYRMTNLQAAIGVAQYERLDHILALRKDIVTGYKNRLEGLIVKKQEVLQGTLSSNWVFALSLTKECLDTVTKALSENQIEYRRCFEPMSRQPAFNNARISSSLKDSTELYDSIILLPTHSLLTQNDLDKICLVLRDAILKS